MAELSDIILKQTGLRGKEEIFWNQETKKFETKDHVPVKVKPVGQPITVISHYHQKAQDLGHNPYVGGTSYRLGKITHLDSRLVGENSHLVVSANYFCTGEPVQTEDFPHNITTFTPLTLYVGSKR